MRKVVALFVALVAVFTVATLAVSDAEEERYPYSLAFAGGEEGWPVWGETLVFDGESVWTGGGSLHNGFGYPPRSGAVVGRDPSKLPEHLRAQWFSHRAETLYEVDLDLPDDFPAKVDDWLDLFPPNSHSHSLLVGYSGRGAMTVWWKVFCHACEPNTPSGELYRYFPIVKKATGSKKEVAVDEFCSQILAFVNQGIMPLQQNSSCRS